MTAWTLFGVIVVCAAIRAALPWVADFAVGTLGVVVSIAFILLLLRVILL